MAHTISYRIADQRRHAQTYAEDKLRYKDLTYKIRGILFKLKIGWLRAQRIGLSNIIEQDLKRRILFEEKTLDVIHDGKKLNL